MLRAWMTDSVAPAAHHDTLPGRWVAEKTWPPPAIAPHRLFLRDDGLRAEEGTLQPRPICSPQTVGRHAGEWCPFGSGSDQADDQREDDARSLVFETAPLDRALEILGAPVATLDVASDRPIAHLVVRLSDVQPSGGSLRVSYGILNLAHRDGHETPTPLVVGQRYRVRVPLDHAGSVFPAGHKIRLALSTTYWPMIWPGPEAATLTLFGGSLDLPVRPQRPPDPLRQFPAPETAPPEKISRPRPGVERIDRLGLELATEGTSTWHVDDGDPLSARADLRRTDTLARDAWKIAIETRLRLSSTRDSFRLRASLRAREGGTEVCHRTWDCAIARDCL
jgi:predicted acyl esterase